MPTRPPQRLLFRPSPALVLLAILLGSLLLVGGASRADVPAQIATRAVTWIVLVLAIVLNDPPALGRVRPVALLLAGAVLIALFQLVPLPPAIWTALPGRGLLTEAATVSGQPQPWRPWSIVPGATVNAASSLVVPVAALLLVAAIRDDEQRWLPGLLLTLVTASMIVGLLQFSGAGFDNPLVNDTPGQVSGLFANRNHFAVFLAFGFLLLPVWMFLDGRSAGWRGPAGLGLTLLLVLTILAAGSRAGLALGILALGIGLFFARHGIRRELRRAPRWVFPALIVAIVAALAIFVLVSVAAGRAEAINRALDGDPGQDMRRRGLSTVLTMIRIYFPWGTGLGSFDPMFRIHEPLNLLKLTFFNHAHDDYLEIALTTGLPGLLLLTGALGWWLYASARAWRGGSGLPFVMARLGSAMLLLVFLASLFDYPARTPLMMASIVLAASWLARAQARSALPEKGQHL